MVMERKLPFKDSDLEEPPTIPEKRAFPIQNELCNRIDVLCREYEGSLPATEVIGALELVKAVFVNESLSSGEK